MPRCRKNKRSANDLYTTHDFQVLFEHSKHILVMYCKLVLPLIVNTSIYNQWFYSRQTLTLRIQNQVFLDKCI